MSQSVHNHLAERLADNVRGVQDRVAAACARVNRSPDDVTIVAVTKYAELDWVRTLIQLGHRTLGEARPQQLEERAEQMGPKIEWHLIGHLQRNKVRKVLPIVSRIHSVDSVKLLDRIDRIGAELELRPQVLLEVNVVQDDKKDGFTTERLRQEWETVAALETVHVTGLMTMAPHTDDESVIRNTFRTLRELRDELRERSGGNMELPELSMGMSGDLEIGIEEGATHIRPGSTLFTGLDS